MPVIVPSQAGILFRRRYHAPGAGTGPYKLTPDAPYAIDVECKIKASTTISRYSGSTDQGMQWVAIDFATQALGVIPTVLIADEGVATGITMAVLGCIHDAHGDLTGGEKVWVRVWGYHDNARVDGNSANVAKGERLQVSTTAGAAIQFGVEADTGAEQLPVGFAMEAITADNQPANVFITNPFGVPI